MIRFTALALFAFLTSAQAFALPLVNATDRPALAVDTSILSAIEYNFEGIIELDNCSGSLIRLKNSADEDQALVLTNGHCIGQMPAPGEVIVNQPSGRRMQVLDHKTGRAIGTVQASKILYSTMTGTDMTIYVLKQTYAEIRNRFNTRARMLADRYPNVGEEIDIISGYWKIGYTCSVEKIIPTLREADWTMHESILYSRPGCATKGGTSGSPIISVQTGEVIGVNNTGNENGARCTMNNPCEVDTDGKVTYEKGKSYGQQTHWLYACLSGPTEVDLNLPGCKLAK